MKKIFLIAGFVFGLTMTGCATTGNESTEKISPKQSQQMQFNDTYEKVSALKLANNKNEYDGKYIETEGDYVMSKSYGRLPSAKELCGYDNEKEIAITENGQHLLSLRLFFAVSKQAEEKTYELKVTQKIRIKGIVKKIDNTNSIFCVSEIEPIQ